MKKIYIMFLGALLMPSLNAAFGQVGISTNTPNGALDISSTTDGLLIPRVALTNTTTATVVTPTASELIYNTATVNDVTPGFYYWNGATWVRMATGTTTNDWSLTGNAGTTPGTNFLGTTSNVDLRIKTNNADRFDFTNNGRLRAYDNGTLALPTYSWNGDTGTGIWRPSAGTLAFSTSATEKMRIEPDGDVGIGATPDVSAKLHISATDRGMLIPNVVLTATNVAAPITTPATSLLIYNTNTTAGVNGVSPGYYYWNGSWIRMATGGNNDWSLNGNTGTVAGTNYLGTTDAIDLRIKTAGTDRWNISNANGGQLQSYSLGSAALPTYSFQGDPNTGIFSSAADALDFTTGGTARFRIPNANQVHALSLGTAALPFYTFQADPDTGMFSNTANTLAFSTNATERMRILATGQAIVNNTGAPFATDVFSAYSSGTMTRAICGYSTLTNGRGIYGQGTGTNGAGVQGGTNQAAGFGVWGFNANVLGTGVMGAGHNQIATYLTGGSGGAFSGLDTGIYGFISTGNEGQGMLLQDDFSAQWNVGYFDAATLSYYKIIGDGTVSTTVKDANGNKVVMHCTETPENLFEDYGTAQLINGRVTIQIDPIFSKNIMVDEKHPLKVFVQLEGECKGVYVTNKSATSFEVVELQGGQSNTPFSFSIVATRAGETYTSSKGQIRQVRYDQRFEQAPRYQEHRTMKNDLRLNN